MAHELNRGILQDGNILPERGVARNHYMVADSEPGRLSHLYAKSASLVLDEKGAIGLLQCYHAADLHEVSVIANGIKLGQTGDGYLFRLPRGGLFDHNVCQARTASQGTRN